MFYLRFVIIGCFLAFFIVDGFVYEKQNLTSSIQVHARPFIDFNRDDAQGRVFGVLEFRGGLELSSSDSRFGGISAFRVQPDGEHFLALSDRAYWLQGRIVYDGNRPTGLADTEIAPVIGPDKKHAKRWDTESIAENGKGLYMGVEGLDRIPYFLFNDPVPVYKNSIPFPAGVKDLPRNGGLEALELLPKNGGNSNTLIAFSENGIDKHGNLRAYCIDDEDRYTFSVKRTKNYDISDAVLWTKEHLLILERKYDLLSGVSIRIRKIPVDSIKQDAVVDGPIILEADMQYQVDNMESISLHHDKSGATVLTLFSDDNYSSIQRNLLLQFTLADE